MSVSDNALEPAESGAGAVLPKYLTPDSWPRWLIYIFAVVLVVATFFLRLSFAESFSERPLLILFVLPIILSAYLGGLWPGLLATLVAAVVVDYFLIPPIQQFSMAKSADMLQWSLLVINGILISALNEALHRSRRQTLRLASFPHLNPNPVLEIDSAGIITYANPAALATLEKLGPPFGLDDFLPPDWQEVERAARQNRQRQFYRQIHLNDAVYGLTIAFAAPFDVCRIYTTDITERRQLEEALWTGEALFRAAFENANVGMTTVGLDGRHLQVNRALCQMLGYSREELESMSVADTTHPDDRQISADFIQRSLGGEVDGAHFEKRHLHKQGQTVWVQVSSSLVRDAQGAPLYYISHVLDITERQQAEASLRESEERLRWALQASGGGAWDWDLLSGEAWWSPEMYPLWGVAPGTRMRLHNSLALVHVQDRDRVKQAVEAAIAGHEDYQIEFRIVPPDQGERWMASYGRPMYDQSGWPVRLIGISLDVTERRQLEEALKASEARLRLFIEYAPAALAMFDKDMRYLSVSRRWLSDFDLGDRDILGLCHYDLFPDLPKSWHEAHRRGLAGDVVRSEADRFERADGSVGWHQWEVRPWYDASGRLGGIVIFTVDITERQQAEEALSHSLAEKTALLKEVHHRVKNNLQIVASLINLQAKRTPSREVIEVLQDTGNRVHSMALLHEVLYRSSNLAAINFAAYVDELCQHLRSSSGPVSARVTIVQRVAPVGLPMELSLPCGLIINELVSNALKHAFPGERQGRITVELNPAPPDRLSLSVRDDGIGPPPDLDIVNASTLGLRLVSRLAAQIQGHLTVTCPEGGGLAFNLVFPAPTASLPKD